MIVRHFPTLQGSPLGDSQQDTKAVIPPTLENLSLILHDYGLAFLLQFRTQFGKVVNTVSDASFQSVSICLQIDFQSTTAL